MASSPIPAICRSPTARWLPSYNFVGLSNYFQALGPAALVAGDFPTWRSLATLYIVICSVLGLGLAILLDQKIRAEGLLRPIYLYPMALSFIVTGTAWKWFLDPGIGLENTMHLWGWESFQFAWIKDRNYAIYCVVIAAVWQSTGFIMAMFLAGLRGVDNEIIKAAQIDGASSTTIYRRIIIPLMRPVFLSAFVVLAHLAIKAYDLVVALTGGGPGQATELPATFMYSYTFTPQLHGHRRLVGDHHAGDDLLDHHPLPLFRNQRGEARMSVQSPDNAISSGRLTRALIYTVLILFAAYSLLPLYVMLVNSFKPLDEIRQGGMLNIPQTWTLDPWRSAWSTAQIGVQPTGLKPLLYQLDPDGRSRRCDLHDHRRAQRVRAHQMALSRAPASSSACCFCPASSRSRSS